MKRSDISDEHAIDLAQRWQDSIGRFPGLAGPQPGVVTALMAEGVPEKVALAKVMHLCDRGLLEYGTSPYHAWPTPKVAELRAAVVGGSRAAD